MEVCMTKYAAEVKSWQRQDADAKAYKREVFQYLISDLNESLMQRMILRYSCKAMLWI